MGQVAFGMMAWARRTVCDWGRRLVEPPLWRSCLCYPRGMRPVEGLDEWDRVLDPVSESGSDGEVAR